MDRKTISKSILKMKIFIIPILIQVQATNLASISFHRTLVSMSVPNFSKFIINMAYFMYALTLDFKDVCRCL